MLPFLKSLAASIPPKTAVRMVPTEMRNVRMKTMMEVCPVFLMILPIKVTLHSWEISNTNTVTIRASPS